ncbi:2577_t:CDS:2, partial [Cetraspora pellucida]
ENENKFKYYKSTFQKCKEEINIFYKIPIEIIKIIFDLSDDKSLFNFALTNKFIYYLYLKYVYPKKFCEAARLHNLILTIIGFMDISDEDGYYTDYDLSKFGLKLYLEDLEKIKFIYYNKEFQFCKNEITKVLQNVSHNK